MPNLGHYVTVKPPVGAPMTLAAISHEIRVPLLRLQGLHKSLALMPVGVDGNGDFLFDKAQALQQARFCGDLD